MFNNMKLKTKLLTIGLSLSIVPLLINLVVVYQQNHIMNKSASEECLKLARASLNPIINSVYGMCAAQENVAQQMVNSSLHIARNILAQAGQLNFSTSSANETISWDAVNQFSKESTKVSLPRAMAGETWLGQNYSMNTTSPVVDEVMKISGISCTIFQKLMALKRTRKKGLMYPARSMECLRRLLRMCRM